MTTMTTARARPEVQLPGWLTSMTFGNQLLSLDSCCQANVESDDEASWGGAGSVRQ